MWLKFANHFFTIVIFRALIRVQDDPTHALQYTSHTHNTSHILTRELNLNIYTKIKRMSRAHRPDGLKKYRRGTAPGQPLTTRSFSASEKEPSGKPK
jgi:hypothetical protein